MNVSVFILRKFSDDIKYDPNTMFSRDNRQQLMVRNFGCAE